MLSRMKKWAFTPLVLSLAAMQAGSPLLAADPSTRWARLFPHKVDDLGKKPVTGQDCCVEELAKNIDWLEHHINMNGTVVAKSPDVWGEARLTAHRQEFEQVLAQELYGFDKSRINGAEFVSDQAFMAFALALNARRGPAASAVPLPTITQNATSSSSDTGTPTISQSFTGPTSPFGFASNSFDFKNDVKLEQTEVLDQLANYVNHLHALRRNNEGPDTSDAPGYSMNLVRIPVSILPGENTQKGYGAEISITAEPYLGPALLPTAFREFVINDLVDQLSLPLAQYLNWDPVQVKTAMDLIAPLREPEPDSPTPFFQNSLRELYYRARAKANLPLEGEVLPIELPPGAAESADPALAPKSAVPDWKAFVNIYSRSNTSVGFQSKRQQLPAPRQGDIPLDAPGRNEENTNDTANNNSQYSLIPLVATSSAATRRSTFPFPPSQMDEVFGRFELAEITYQIYRTFAHELINREVLHVSDLQAYLREEAAAAYELLSQDQVHAVWELECNAGPGCKIADLVRTRNALAINDRRNAFFATIRQGKNHTVTADLAWCLYVDSLLLNERLVRDIKKTFGNTPNSPADPGWMPYYEPDPPQEACDAFAEYVKIRWPIHVFALDPVINEQNIADVRSIYRQMQMSVAVAYATGGIGTSAALQAMRKLQRDRATIDLKRTAIAFEHGDDTFGWRFTPRFQTPPVEGNATVFFRDLVCGGPTDKQLQKAERLEPGVRECSAIIIMPSFVPHVTLHSRGNWYKLNAPTRTGDSVHDTVHFSRAIKQMEQNAELCCQCAHLYRNGEIERLMKRVHQIDRKIGLQTLECQVPIENTHGGCEILTAGKRELAPELTGWYGAPGYDPNKGTSLFLSGGSFSVTKSRLIVGNQHIHCKLLSRQIMEVQLPPGLTVIRDRNLDGLPSEQYLGYVDAQLASPYGVSGHMLIPVVRPSSVVPLVTTLRANRLKIKARLQPGPGGKLSDRTTYVVAGYSFAPVVNQLRVDVPKDSGLLERSSLQAVLFTKQDSSRLVNIPPFTLTRSDEGQGFEASNDFFATQFASDGKLGGIVTSHLNYQLQNGQAQVGTKVSYQLGVGVSTYPAAQVADNPLTKVQGAMEIEVSFIEPPPGAAAATSTTSVGSTKVDGAPVVSIVQPKEKPADPKPKTPASTPLVSASADAQFKSNLQLNGPAED